MTKNAAADIESQYRSIFENAVEGIYQTTVEGRYLRVNPALAKIYGYDTTDDLIVGLTDIAGQLYVDPTRRDDFKRIMQDDGVVRDFEAQVYRADHSVIWITENARCVRGPDGGIQYYEGTVEDITRRKSDEEQIRLLAKVFDSVGDGIIIVDRSLTVKAVNPAYESITSFSASELMGAKLDMLAPGYHEKTFMPSIWAELTARGHWSGEATCRRLNGAPFVAALSVAAVEGSDDALAPEASGHFVITCSDISFRKRQEQRIRHQANYDLLTQLPNRWLATERLEQAILLSQRQKTGLAVLYLDLNGFKQVNDGMGHQAGDELLRLVAKRLRASTRLSDVVGRLGGDEFIIGASDLTDPRAGSNLAHKILYNFADPFVINGREIYCLPSIGVARYPHDGNTADLLVRNADMAMYAAKQNKARPVVVFEPHMLSVAAERLDIENDLRRALARKEFVLYYQPKVDSSTHEIIGAEALVRWQHPEKGFVPPGAFISLAEECGLIMAIGEWTLREACAQFVQWRAANLALKSVSVNLSPTQFLDRGLVDVVQRILVETGIEPGCLELELTEGAMAVDIEQAITTLGNLRALGVKLSIDDFGTGYSSLAYLKRLPIDVVKIDRSFVKDLGNSPADGQIVGAIIALADRLGFNVVAEGVETGEQASILKDSQCELLQGYLFSKPVAPGQFAELFSAPA
ncbi:MAG: EAL domain-containing protein [Rhodospirillaceae bacterium]|nr:EAL domain-containing protein [Rhodospirillaceae bacterium]